MSISAEFKEAISEKDKTLVRIMLKDSLLLDKTFKDFDDMSKYALENGLSDLYDKHNSKVFLDESQWTEDYLNEEKGSVVRNFSKERIEVLKQIINKLYPQVKEDKSCINFHKNLGVGVIGAGAITTVIGICISETVPIISGVAVMGLGVGLVLLSNKE